MPKRTGNPFPFDPFRDLPPSRVFDVFRDIATWQELRDACGFLRQLLAPASDTRVTTTYYGRLLLRALWAAMKRIGDGDVPPWPKPMNRDTYSALFQKGVQSVEPERFYFECRRRMLDAIAVVDRWCEATGEKPKGETESETDSKKNPNDPRDKFAYTSLKAGKSLQEIKNKINSTRKWEPLETVQGVSAGAKRYAMRQRPPLPWPIVQR